MEQPLTGAARAYLVKRLHLHYDLVHAGNSTPSEAHSELRSEMTGKIVDSYTNIQTVKLFAGKGQEDHAVADATDRFNYGWIRVMRTSTRMVAVMSFANGFLLAATGALAVWAWVNTNATVGIVATAVPWSIPLRCKQAGSFGNLAVFSSTWAPSLRQSKHCCRPWDRRRTQCPKFTNPQRRNSV